MEFWERWLTYYSTFFTNKKKQTNHLIQEGKQTHNNYAN